MDLCNCTEDTGYPERPMDLAVEMVHLKGKTRILLGHLLVAKLSEPR